MKECNNMKNIIRHNNTKIKIEAESSSYCANSFLARITIPTVLDKNLKILETGGTTAIISYTHEAFMKQIWNVHSKDWKQLKCTNKLKREIRKIICSVYILYLGI